MSAAVATLTVYGVKAGLHPTERLTADGARTQVLAGVHPLREAKARYRRRVPRCEVACAWLPGSGEPGRGIGGRWLIHWGKGLRNEGAGGGL